MKFTELKFPGCYLIEPFCHKDKRGEFIKTFHNIDYNSHGLELSVKEEFISVSKKEVLRGMHFQLPPAAQNKLVYCLKGEVLDGFIDLRIGSPTYKRCLTVNLSDSNRNILFLPEGIAHGFLTLSHEAVMIYKTSTVHYPEYDAGIFWKGCGIDWPTENPTLSERDECFPVLNEFESPFSYELI